MNNLKSAREFFTGRDITDDSLNTDIDSLPEDHPYRAIYNSLDGMREELDGNNIQRERKCIAMEIRRWEDVTVTYIPKSGVLQIWGKEDGEEVSLGLFYV